MRLFHNDQYDFLLMGRISVGSQLNDFGSIAMEVETVHEEFK